MADSTQGTPAPQAGQGEDAPKYVTAEELNRAITARFADFSKKSEKTLTESFGAFEKKLAELVAAKPEPQADPAKPPSIQDHPDFKGMTKKLADLEARAAAAEAKTEAERAKGKDLSLRQRLADELAKAGIKDPTRAKHAARFLVDGERLVKWNEEGDALVFRDAEAGEVDFSTGFKGWLKSDDAKLYLPSPDAAPPGARPAPPQRIQPQGGPLPNADDLSFDDKLGNAAAQIAKLGLGLP